MKSSKRPSRRQISDAAWKLTDHGDGIPSPEMNVTVEASDSTATAEDQFSSLLQAILNRTYESASTDGSVSVTTRGDDTVCAAAISAHRRDGIISAAATQAARRSLQEARRHTAKAMAELPGMNPHLRQMLIGEGQ